MSNNTLTATTATVSVVESGGARSPEGVEFRVCLETDLSQLELLRGKWDEAVIELGGSVYMSYDWVRTWWEFYGTGKQLRILFCYAGPRIVAIVPLYIDRVGLGPLSCSIARLVGSNIPPKVFNPPIHPDYAQKVLEATVQQLFEKDTCDLLSLGPLSEEHPPTQALEDAARSANPAVAAFQVVGGVHSVFWLPANMEDYYATLSKNERKNRRKYELRLLKKEYETTLDVIRDPAATQKEFEEFVTQHTLHWNAQGKPGHFKAWPKATEFNRALVTAQAAQGRLRFIRIVANGQVIARQYVFAFGKTYFWELPARIVGDQWERFSLGPTGIVTMIETAIKEGMTRLEGGLAHYDYKLRLNAKEYATKTLRLVSNRPTSRIRAALAHLLRFCLHLSYHKAWYKRLRTYLPGFRNNPQWTGWLRLDF